MRSPANIKLYVCVKQSIHSNRLSVQSCELAPPIPSPTSECCSPSMYAIIPLRVKLFEFSLVTLSL
jgi:hypothetical protein